jgi:hypothetical protein
VRKAGHGYFSVRVAMLTHPPMVFFAGVAWAAEDLEVVGVVGAAFVEWGDVVEGEVGGAAAVGAVGVECSEVFAEGCPG